MAQNEEEANTIVPTAIASTIRLGATKTNGAIYATTPTRSAKRIAAKASAATPKVKAHRMRKRQFHDPGEHPAVISYGYP